MGNVGKSVLSEGTIKAMRPADSSIMWLSTILFVAAAGTSVWLNQIDELDTEVMTGIILAAFIISVFIGKSFCIADQWEKATVLRLGKFSGLKGPGFFFVIPLVDRVANYIDQRLIVTDIVADSTLTKDTVPVNVDAIIYWTVWDAEKAALEVQDYSSAISFIALTSLRDIIGKNDLAELLQNRDKIGAELQEVLDAHTNPWGITIQTVGIKDITIPPGLADAMSKQAQAERERQARIILGTAETEIAIKFAEASKHYAENPVALQLRGMNMLYEGLKEKGSLIIVPSSALESMNLGGMTGLASMAKK